MHDIRLSPEGHPRSLLFDDRYFDEADGLAESRHVYLAHNRLPERFASLESGKLFRIGESGFGSGLNFLATAELWTQVLNAKRCDEASSAPRGVPTPTPLPYLLYQSLERYPLSRDDLDAIVSRWSELKPFSEALLEKYIVSTNAVSIFDFPEWRLQLRIVWKDILDALDDFEGPIDAWYFDGFSPRKNPEMWSEQAFRKAFEKSSPESSGTTFTVAAWVRKNFEGAGFITQKTPGFGRKKEMLRVLYPCPYIRGRKSLRSRDEDEL